MGNIIAMNLADADCQCMSSNQYVRSLIRASPSSKFYVVPLLLITVQEASNSDVSLFSFLSCEVVEQTLEVLSCLDRVI